MEVTKPIMYVIQVKGIFNFLALLDITVFGCLLLPFTCCFRLALHFSYKIYVYSYTSPDIVTGSAKTGLIYTSNYTHSVNHNFPCELPNISKFAIVDSPMLKFMSSKS